MNHDALIIGGGVAGLSAACRLAELGVKPIVIEAEDYPSHKICGEFFSPDCLASLAHWNIFPIPILNARLHTDRARIDIPFSDPAGSLSHFQFDPLLRDYAVRLGSEIKVRTKVEKIIPKSCQNSLHEVVLSSGETVKTATLVVATGRVPQIAMKVPPKPYIGFKAHFKDVVLKDSLEMFVFRGAYLGLLPIEEGKCNMACLCERKLVEEKGSISLFVESLKQQNQTFKQYMSHSKSLFEDWMQTYVPEFGFKNVPDWPDTYFIGDAASTIPPASGAGLSLALASGILAADFIKKGDPVGFKKVWYKQSRSTIYLGKALHFAMLRPSLHHSLVKVGAAFPSLAAFSFQQTRLKQISSAS